MHYAHQTGGVMVPIDHRGTLKVGELVEVGALLGVCATSAGETHVLRVGGQVVGPVKASEEVPAQAGAPVYLDKSGNLSTVGAKTARAAGVLLSAGARPRILLRGILA